MSNITFTGIMCTIACVGFATILTLMILEEPEGNAETQSGSSIVESMSKSTEIASITGPDDIAALTGHIQIVDNAVSIIDKSHGVFSYKAYLEEDKLVFLDIIYTPDTLNKLSSDERKEAMAEFAIEITKWGLSEETTQDMLITASELVYMSEV